MVWRLFQTMLASIYSKSIRVVGPSPRHLIPQRCSKTPVTGLSNTGDENLCRIYHSSTSRSRGSLGKCRDGASRQMMSQSSNLTSTGAHLILSLAQYTERKVRKRTVRYRITTLETLAPILPWRRCANSWRGHSGSQYSAGNKIIHHRYEASRSGKVIGQYNTADVDVPGIVSTVPACRRCSGKRPHWLCH